MMTSTEQFSPSNPGPNQAPTLMAVAWTLVVLSSIVFGMRVFVRASVVRRVGLDDYMMALSWCGNVIFASLLTISCSYGLGRHMESLDPYDRVQAMKWDFTAQAWGVLTPMFGRISFALSLMTLIGTSRLIRAILHSVIWMQVAAGISTVILIYVQCGSHIAGLWNPAVRAIAHCWSPNVQTYYGYFQSSVNSLHDLILTILPAWILSKLQMSTKYKVALIFLLGLSFFAMISSIIKTYELSNLGRRNDFTWNIPIFFIWVEIELNIVIIAASVPTIKPLFSSSRGLNSGQKSSSMHNTYEMYGHNRRMASSAKLRSIDMDTASQEDMLGHEGSYAIKKTTDISVTSVTESSIPGREKGHSYLE